MENLQAHCVTLLRLAMHSQREYAKHSRNDESFTHALKDFSDEVELILRREEELQNESKNTPENNSDDQLQN